MVTSANIKNGTIQAIDLSAKAKRMLKGNVGRIGPLGPPGPIGQTGAQGPAGFNSVLTASGSTLISPNQGGTAVASCYGNYKAVGGGFYASSPNVSVYVSQPVSGGWQARGFNYGTTFSELLFAYVLCASS